MPCERYLFPTFPLPPFSGALLHAHTCTLNPGNAGVMYPRSAHFYKLECLYIFMPFLSLFPSRIELNLPSVISPSGTTRSCSFLMQYAIRANHSSRLSWFFPWKKERRTFRYVAFKKKNNKNSQTFCENHSSRLSWFFPWKMYISICIKKKKLKITKILKRFARIIRRGWVDSFHEKRKDVHFDM